MNPRTSLFSLSVAALFMMADSGAPAGGGAAPPTDRPLSLDAQLTASQTRVTELEQLQTAWGTEKATLTQERDTAVNQVATLNGQVQTLTTERNTAQASVTSLTTQLATATGHITTLTRERDDAIALSKNPSAQAAAILATAGVPAVQTKVDGTNNPADTGKAPASAPTQTGLKGAAAKMAAYTAEKRG